MTRVVMHVMVCCVSFSVSFPLSAMRPKSFQIHSSRLWDFIICRFLFLVIIWTQFVMVKCRFANYLQYPAVKYFIISPATTTTSRIIMQDMIWSTTKTVAFLIQHHHLLAALDWSAANSSDPSVPSGVILEIRGGSTIVKDPCRKNG